jgi:hypothetical protein
MRKGFSMSIIKVNAVANHPVGEGSKRSRSLELSADDGRFRRCFEVLDNLVDDFWFTSGFSGSSA